jgi:type II secretory pathway pseudopilin PulG
MILRRPTQGTIPGAARDRTRAAGQGARLVPRDPRTRRAFTMIEIAIALAVIGFALVAIIGILPMGLNIQKETREKTIINHDAMYFLDALKNSAQQLDDLPNFVTQIEVDNATYRSGVDFVNGYEVIGLLTRTSQVATAYVTAMTGTAMDRNPSSRDLSFGYRMRVMMTPLQNFGVSELNDPFNDSSILTNLQNRVWDIRLEFAWPLRGNPSLGNTNVGGGRAVYRALATGVMDYDYRNLPVSPNPTPNRNYLFIWR